MLQTEADDLPVISGRDVADITDASVARGGDEVSQSQQSRHTAPTSAAAASFTGEF